jgi:hypothetical protein
LTNSSSDADGGCSGARCARRARAAMLRIPLINRSFMGIYCNSIGATKRFARHRGPWAPIRAQTSRARLKPGLPADFYAARSDDIASNGCGGSRLIHLAEVRPAPISASAHNADPQNWRDPRPVRPRRPGRCFTAFAAIRSSFVSMVGWHAPPRRDLEQIHSAGDCPKGWGFDARQSPHAVSKVSSGSPNLMLDPPVLG